MDLLKLLDHFFEYDPARAADVGSVDYIDGVGALNTDSIVGAELPEDVDGDGTDDLFEFVTGSPAE